MPGDPGEITLVLTLGTGAALATTILTQVARWGWAQLKNGRQAPQQSTQQVEARGVNVQVGGGSGMTLAERECARGVERRLDQIDERDRQRAAYEGRLVEILAAIRDSNAELARGMQELLIRAKTEG